MSEMLNKIEKSENERRVENRAIPQERYYEREEMKSRKSALAGMKTSQEPERGRGHILVRSVTEQVFRTVQSGAEDI